MTGRAALAAVVLTLGLATAGCSRSTPPAPDAVFLVVVDTLRPDRLSCYGYAEHATPHIDALARRGVRFERAQSVASWTIPGMGAMLTSLYPTQLGLIENPGPQGARYDWRELREQLNDTISADERTLAEMFHDAGYSTAAFVDQPGLIAYGNFFQGFDVALYPSGVRRIARFDPETLEYPKWPPFLRNAYGSDEELIGEFERWLGNLEHERPIFVWLHLLTPHWPYDPPAEFMPGHEVARTDADKLQPRFYDGEVRAADALVGRVTRAIDDAVGLDRSLVVFTSDHGEALGEHGMYDHGHTLHAEVLRVPLIVAGPGLPRGRTVEAEVRSIDILPTLAELVPGLRTPPGAQGASLLAAIDGGGEPRWSYAEAMLYGETERALSGGGFKLMYEDQARTYRLFDVRADPGETVDVGALHPSTAERMRQRLVTLHGELAASAERRDVRRPPAAGRRGRVEEALRALGYLGD